MSLKDDIENDPTTRYLFLILFCLTTFFMGILIGKTVTKKICLEEVLVQSILETGGDSPTVFLDSNGRPHSTSGKVAVGEMFCTRPRNVLIWQKY